MIAIPPMFAAGLFAAVTAMPVGHLQRMKRVLGFPVEKGHPSQSACNRFGQKYASPLEKFLERLHARPDLIPYQPRWSWPFRQYVYDRSFNRRSVFELLYMPSTPPLISVAPHPRILLAQGEPSGRVVGVWGEWLESIVLPWTK